LGQDSRYEMLTETFHQLSDEIFEDESFSKNLKYTIRIII